MVWAWPSVPARCHPGRRAVRDRTDNPAPRLFRDAWGNMIELSETPSRRGCLSPRVVPTSADAGEQVRQCCTQGQVHADRRVLVAAGLAVVDDQDRLAGLRGVPDEA